MIRDNSNKEKQVFLSRERIPILEKRLDELRAQRKKKLKGSNLSRLLGYIYILFLGPGILFFGFCDLILTTEHNTAPTFFLLGVLIIFVGFGALLLSYVYKPTREVDTEIEDILNELDLLNIEVAPREQRAEKLFKVHQFELKKYYDLTLAQSRWIFYVGVLCIVAGFVIIGFTGWGLYYFIEAGKKLKEGLLIGATGLLSTILVEFIGKVFIDMYKKTIESLGEFHKRLVATHHLHFANFLVAKIANETAREKVLADIASNLGGVEVVEGETP